MPACPRTRMPRGKWRAPRPWLRWRLPAAPAAPGHAPAPLPDPGGSGWSGHRSGPRPAWQARRPSHPSSWTGGCQAPVRRTDTPCSPECPGHRFPTSGPSGVRCGGPRQCGQPRPCPGSGVPVRASGPRRRGGCRSGSPPSAVRPGSGWRWSRSRRDAAVPGRRCTPDDGSPYPRGAFRCHGRGRQAGATPCRGVAGRPWRGRPARRPCAQ